MVYSFFVLLQIYLQHPDKADIHKQFNCGLSVVNSLVFTLRPKVYAILIWKGMNKSKSDFLNWKRCLNFAVIISCIVWKFPQLSDNVLNTKGDTNVARLITDVRCFHDYLIVNWVPIPNRAGPNSLANPSPTLNARLG